MVLTWFASIAVGIFITYLLCNGDRKYLKSQIADLAALLETKCKDIEFFEKKWLDEIEKNKELIRQKSSQATKSGNYIETLSPLLEKFPANIFDSNTSVRFLGEPIDFISYNFETPEILFIEVKSGDAGLSSRQKIVKRIVKEGLIRFIEFRMNADGTIEVKE
jgi:predicted Holliday junction resolvase-like endonuclease